MNVSKSVEKAAFCSCDSQLRKRGRCSRCGGRIWTRRKKQRITLACALHAHYFCEDASKTWIPGRCEDPCHTIAAVHPHQSIPQAIFLLLALPLIGHIFDMLSTFLAYSNNPTVWMKTESNQMITGLISAGSSYWKAQWINSVSVYVPAMALTCVFGIILHFLVRNRKHNHPTELGYRLMPYFPSISLTAVSLFGALSWIQVLWFLH